MFGLVQRYYCKQYRLAQQERAAALLDHVDLQIAQWRRSGDDAANLEADLYLHDYVLGILDSLTRHFEGETRKRFGVVLHEEFFVEYLIVRFGCAPLVARRCFEAARRRYGCAPQFFQNTAFSGAGHGYADGLSVMSHVPSHARLLRHLLERAAPRPPAAQTCAAND